MITMSNEDVLDQAAVAEVTDNNQRPKDGEILYFQMILKVLLDFAIQKYPPNQQA